MKKEVKELMDLDRKFCEDSQNFKEEGWRKYLSKKTLMGTPKHEPYLEKKEVIVNLLAMIYKLDSISFTWEPHHAFLSEDNTLGVTTGIYTRTYKIDEEALTETGKYTTVWKKQDKEWKIVFDMGN